MIDMRSDTVTRPTAGMKEFMFRAPLGDDVFSEDPSVNELQDKLAALFSMEAALFCPSGTMSNQIALKVHTRPLDEVICDVRSHIYQYEAGGYAFNSGIAVKLIASEKGILSPSDIEANINPDDIHKARTMLVSIENTVNKGGGIYYTLDEMKAISECCRKKKLRLHLDGVRIFNALVESGDRPGLVGPLFDSISICLSKGLGAPVGSVLLGSRDFIREAIRIRKVLGGGMRQAGILAAAGIYALDHHVDRLKEDHERAARLAAALEQAACVESVLPVYTNIVVFTLKPSVNPAEYLEKLKSEGLLAVSFGGQSIRLVTHLDLQEEDIERAIEILGKISA